MLTYFQGRLDILKDYVCRNSCIKVIKFSRNFGHQIAVTAGIDSAIGDAVVIIDADLQDPPELIEQMLDKWNEGNQVVYCTRIERSGESFFKLITAKLFYRLLSFLSTIPIPQDTGDFRLIDRSVVDVLKKMPERDRFLRGMISWVGFKQIALPYHRAERYAGSSKYPLRKMIKFALDGILSFSNKPLQISSALGGASAFVALICLFISLGIRIFTNDWVHGWTTIIFAILFLGGIQLLCIGILGEYIGRIWNEIKHRPLYVVDEYIGFYHLGNTSCICKGNEDK